MERTLAKAACAAAVAGIAETILFGSVDVNAFGTTLNSSIVTGLCVGAGSVASDLASDYFIENMNIPTNVKSLEELAVRGGLGGLAATGALVGFGVPLGNAPTAFILGAGSKLGGDYVEDLLFGNKGITGFRI